MYIAIMLSFLLTGAAAAESSDKDQQTAQPQANRAEYVRLSHELEKLAKRNAWAGVERTYQSMLATGAFLSSEDQKRGAHAAQALGNIAAAKERLLAANKYGEDPEIMDWLWDIDSNYGKVFLAGDMGTTQLACKMMPFNPTQAKAVQYAISRIEQSGTFDGLLPQGDYVFTFVLPNRPDDLDTREVQVLPRVQHVRIDVRSEEGIKEAERRERKEKRNKKDKASD